MRQLFVPANDDRPTEAWLGFYADKELYSYACKHMPDLAHALKVRRNFDNDLVAERSCANFVWFIKFEKNFYDNEAKTLRPKPKAVE